MATSSTPVSLPLIVGRMSYVKILPVEETPTLLGLISETALVTALYTVTVWLLLSPASPSALPAEVD